MRLGPGQLRVSQSLLSPLGTVRREKSQVVSRKQPVRSFRLVFHIVFLNKKKTWEKDTGFDKALGEIFAHGLRKLRCSLNAKIF